MCFGGNASFHHSGLLNSHSSASNSASSRRQPCAPLSELKKYLQICSTKYLLRLRWPHLLASFNAVLPSAAAASTAAMWFLRIDVKLTSGQFRRPARGLTLFPSKGHSHTCCSIASPHAHSKLRLNSWQGPYLVSRHAWRQTQLSEFVQIAQQTGGCGL